MAARALMSFFAHETLLVIRSPVIGSGVDYVGGLNGRIHALKE
jgi:hypothetical protein